MAYRVEFSPASRRQFKKLPHTVQTALAARIDALAQDPRPGGAKKLAGGTHELWRIREGDYRVVYEIRGEILVVLVVKVGHRKEIYRRLKNLR